jgi:hypothetical protein
MTTVITVFRHAPPPLIGVCGVVPDRVSEALEQNLDWLETSGFLVERFDAYRQPEATARFPTVTEFLAGRGERGLPLILLDGVIVSSGVHPTRTQLARIVGQHRSQSELATAR